MHIFFATREALPQDLYVQLARYRHSVFVERLGWKLSVSNRLEQDQFDRTDTCYVVARNEDNQIYGCARLLPTTRPYLLAEVFPELLHGISPPASPDIWELSRFAALNVAERTTSHAGRFSESLAATLFNECVRYAAVLGASHLITASPIGTDRLIRQLGFPVRRAGPPVKIAGRATIGCWIDLIRPSEHNTD